MACSKKGTNRKKIEKSYQTTGVWPPESGRLSKAEPDEAAIFHLPRGLEEKPDR